MNQQETKTFNDDTVLQVNNLSIEFGGLKAVDNLSFSIKEREIFGLIGPNGAGKTTVFNCITQFYRPTSGEILLKTKDGSVTELTKIKVDDIINLGLVRTFQNVELIKELSLMDNVLIGGHIYYKTNIFQQVFRLKKTRQEEKRMREKAADILDSLDIGHLKEALAHDQPYGVMKKVELGRTLMCEPKVIILDEPAAGLNDVETEQLSKMIYDIRKKYNCAILLVEHDMRLVMEICDKVCAISFGKHLATGTPSEIQANPTVQEAYLGKEE